MMEASKPSPITKVLLVGATGTLGSVILKALVQSVCFDISTLRRATDSSPPADAGIEKAVVVSLDPTLDELVAALKGQDAVIAAFQILDVSQHLKLAEAAFHAGVRRYIPADFGSCDPTNPLAQQYFPMYRHKINIREQCNKLVEMAVENGKPFSWTSIVCGHFFDYGLEDRLLHFDLDTHVAQILDGGNIRASASTLPRVAEAVVRVLQLPDETHNQVLYIQSFCPTQLEVLGALERATGTEWRREKLEAKEYLEEKSKQLAEDYEAAAFGIVFVLGSLDTDWRQRKGFAMNLLGLEDENLDSVVASVVAKHKAKAK